MKLPLVLEARVVSVGAPGICRDKNSPRFGWMKTEFVVDKKFSWEKGRTFWGELPKIVGHNIELRSDGIRQELYDLNTGVWYKS